MTINNKTKTTSILTITLMAVLMLIPAGITNNAYADVEYEELWTEQFGTSGNDFIQVATIDNNGNIIVAGYTSGSIDGTNAGSNDAFVRTYDIDGNVLWTEQFGTSGSDVIQAGTIDNNGNIIVAGYTTGSLDGTNAGGGDAFIRTYDTDGNVLWTEQFGTSGYDDVIAVTVDSNGNIIVAGLTQGSLGNTNAGSYDSYVRAYDTDGNVLWTEQFGTSGIDFVYAATVDNNGNIVVAGYTDGSLDGTNAGSWDAFIRAYDTDGNVLWTEQFGTSSIDRIISATVDNNGNIVVAGYTGGLLGSTHIGNWDAFIRAYDTDGNVLWTEQFGTGGTDAAFAVTVDSNGNIIVAGNTQGSLGDTNAGSWDAFVRVYDTDRNVLWTEQFGTSGVDILRAATVDNNGNIVVAGRTTGSLDGTNAGSYDAFIHTYSLVSSSTIPDAPTSLTATSGDTEVSLYWIAPSNDGGDTITDYIIEYSDNGTTWTTFSDGTSTATDETVTGLTNDQEYTFRVSAVNSIGTGNTSDIVIATPETTWIEIEIDIKPDSYPSSVNCKNTNGNVPVAIFGAEDFDVSTIDIDSLELNGFTVTEVHDTIHIEDQNEDEFQDAVLHLNKSGVCEATQDALLKESVDTTLTGFTTDNDKQGFTGTSDIRIVNR